MEDTFTKPVLRDHIIRGFHYGSKYTLIHAYVWDESGRLSLRKTGLRWIGWWCHVVLLVLHSAFVATRALQVKLDGGYEKSIKLFAQFMAVYYSFPIVFMVTYMFSGQELPPWVNESYSTWKRLEAHPLSTMVKRTRSGQVKMMELCTLFTHGMKFGIYFVSFYMVLRPILEPASPEQLTSVFPEPNSLTLIQKLPAALVIAYIEYIYHAYVLLYVFQYIGFVFSLMSALQTIRYVRPEGEEAKRLNSTLNASERLKIFVQLELLCEKMNRTGVIIMPGSQLILSIMAVCSIYGFIRFRGMIVLPLAAFGSLCLAWLVFVFGAFAEIYEYSAQFKNSIVHLPQHERHDELWIKRKFKSIRPMRVVLSCYHADQGMIFTMLEAILDNTINLLVAY